jgi:hypothetical protein
MTTGIAGGHDFFALHEFPEDFNYIRHVRVIEFGGESNNSVIKSDDIVTVFGEIFA